MHLTRTILALTFILTSFTIFGQQTNIEDFKPLKGQGELPEDFTRRTSNKVSEAIEEQVNVNDDIKTKKTKVSFLLRSNYMIDNLLMSGNVLFGDPVTEYTNKVAARILADEPELREELRFYCLKSNVTNAFATNQGMIFITTGLLAQLENEAQLAFILGHEINHFKKKHVINSALENSKIRSTSKRNKISQDETIRQLSSYSKSLELESDSVGFYYLLNAGYDVEEAMSSFNILQFSDLPYDEHVCEFTEFDTDDFIIPESAKLDTLMGINFEIDENDSKSSHPNLNLRRSEIQKLLDTNDNTNKNVNFIISESDFDNIRDLCRFESTRIDLKNINYIKAYYHAKFLSQKNPDNFYLQKTEAKALYGLAKFKSSKNYFSSSRKYSRYEGAISGVHYFFEKNHEDLIALLAIKRIFEINKSKPDEYLELILQDLVNDFINAHEKEDFNFDKFFPFESKQEKLIEEIVESSDSLSNKEITNSEESKYDKLKRLQDEQNEKSKITLIEKTDNNYYQLIFTNYEFREEIKLHFDKSIEKINEKKSLKELADKKYDHLSAKKKKRAIKTDRKKQRMSRKHSNNIGAEKIVFVDPSYYSIDERKGVKLENSEESKYNHYDQIGEIGELTGLETEILSPKLCDKNDSEKVNHLSTCNDWIEELIDLEEIDNKLSFIPSQSEYMQEVSETYNTENFAFSGVLDFKKKKKLKPTDVLAIVIPYGWPFFVAWLVKPQHEVYYYTYVFNSNTGKLEVEQVYTMKRKAMEANINSYMYDNFLTMKTKK